jgi:hypothetical protein
MCTHDNNNLICLCKTLGPFFACKHIYKIHTYSKGIMSNEDLPNQSIMQCSLDNKTARNWTPDDLARLHNHETVWHTRSKEMKKHEKRDWEHISRLFAERFGYKRSVPPLCKKAFLLRKSHNLTSSSFIQNSLDEAAEEFIAPRKWTHDELVWLDKQETAWHKRTKEMKKRNKRDWEQRRASTCSRIISDTSATNTHCAKLRTNCEDTIRRTPFLL